MYLNQTRKDILKWPGHKRLLSPTAYAWWEAYQESKLAQAIIRNVAALLGLTAVDLILRLPAAGRMLYILPVFALTRSAGLRPGIILAAVTTILGAFMDRAGGLGDNWLLNAVIRFTAMTTLAFMVDGMVDRLKLTNDVARHDTLTGALNRHGFAESANAVIAEALIDGTEVVVAVIDLDDFKPVNDLYGHAFGDKILKTLVECLAPAVADGGLIARNGGDEFQLLFTGDPILVVEQAMIRAMNRFSDSTLVLGHRATFSYGIASLHHKGATLEQLLSVADSAMYRKKSTRGRRLTDRIHAARHG